MSVSEDLNIIDPFLPLTGAKARRRPSGVARLMIVVAVVAAIIPPAGFLVGLIDILYQGPYTTSFNERCQRIAVEANLVGRPDADVVGILGPPTFLSDDDPNANPKTFNYCPFPLFPFAKFQVHCHDGIVTSLEMYDD